MFDPNKVRLAVIGQGYVGLPLALEFSKYIEVVGFDVKRDRINSLKIGIDTNNEHLPDEFEGKNLHFTTDISELKGCNIYIVTVPTPIDCNKQPELSALKDACWILGDVLKKNDIVVFESTVHPGCTEDFCAPILEQASKLKCGLEIHLGYSPERINPGDRVNTLSSIKKIVSAQNPNTLNKLISLYDLIITAGVVPAASIKTAEAAKLTENIQRDVNIALMNELSLTFQKMDISINEVLKVASSKWNFIPFKPGMVGGHCIGVDPYYLISEAEKFGEDLPLISASRRINESIVQRIYNHFEANVEQNYGKVILFGCTFKNDCSDLRNSKALEFALKMSKKCRVDIYDPNVTPYYNERYNFVEDFSQAPYDAVFIMVEHSQFRLLDKDFFLNLVTNERNIYDLHDRLGLTNCASCKL